MNFAINFTLIVQAINFIIAFVILNKLFLKAAVKLLLIEEEQFRQLKKTIIMDQDNLKIQKKLATSAWINLQEKLRSKQPLFEINSEDLSENLILSKIKLQEKKHTEELSIEESSKYFSNMIIQRAKLL